MQDENIEALVVGVVRLAVRDAVRGDELAMAWLADFAPFVAEYVTGQRDRVTLSRSRKVVECQDFRRIRQ